MVQACEKSSFSNIIKLIPDTSEVKIRVRDTYTIQITPGKTTLFISDPMELLYWIGPRDLYICAQTKHEQHFGVLDSGLDLPATGLKLRALGQRRRSFKKWKATGLIYWVRNASQPR